MTLKDLVNHVNHLTRDKELLEKSDSQRNQTILIMSQDNAQMNEIISAISQTNTDQGRENLGLKQTCNNLASQVNTFSLEFFSLLHLDLHDKNSQNLVKFFFLFRLSQYL